MIHRQDSAVRFTLNEGGVDAGITLYQSHKFTALRDVGGMFSRILIECRN